MFITIIFTYHSLLEFITCMRSDDDDNDGGNQSEPENEAGSTNERGED